MRVVVCVRRGPDGELGAFDAAAYETALRIPEAEVILLSMGVPQTKDYLLQLTRLGAKKAVLLSDPVFAGADTLATAYTLSLAVRKLSPELVLCGRQTLVGDTAQTGPMLSAFCDMSLITQVTGTDVTGNAVSCTTLEQGMQQVKLPAVLTMERCCTLRLPSFRSRPGAVEVWNAADLDADPHRCGLQGSPTRVLKTFENTSGRRKCRFIAMKQLPEVIRESLQNRQEPLTPVPTNPSRLKKVCIAGETPRVFAETVSDDITVLPMTTEEELTESIRRLEPNAVLWGSDPQSKRLAARVSARLGLGLCADCTALEADQDQLIMSRPALAGSVIAVIKSRTKPAMATVRTAGESGSIVVAAGWGAGEQLDALRQFASRIGAELAASRKMVDHGRLPYALQVGLTGRTVSPPVYIAVGISGAVHHLAGMQRAGTVIAINPDRDAPIFEYADYGILCGAEEIQALL